MKTILRKDDIVEIGGCFYYIESEGSDYTLPVIKRCKNGDPYEWEKICNDNTPITILKLSNRSFNALETADIITVGQVAQFGLRRLVVSNFELSKIGKIKICSFS